MDALEPSRTTHRPPHVGRSAARYVVAGLLALVLQLPARADEEPALAPEARAERGMRSHIAAERAEAVRTAARHGGSARTWARAWVTSSHASVRAGGWGVLGHVGTTRDLRAALEALGDPQPTVCREAAEAVVRMAARLPLDAEPWVPVNALDRVQTRALAFVLAARLGEAPTGTVAPIIERLGEGVVPCLEHVLRHPRFDDGVRRSAIVALAHVGGRQARRALSGLVPLLEQANSTRLWEAWWQALIEAGPGRGLEEAHALVVEFAKSARDNRWPNRPPGLRWRNQVYFYRFVAMAPPAEGIYAVREYIDHLLEEHAGEGRFRLFPSMVGEIVRTHLIVAEPNDDRLRWDVLAARPPPRNRWRQRAEELGEVLVHLEPYREREGVQKGLVELLRHKDLPKTVRAWAAYLEGKTSKAGLRMMAEALIDADGAAATLAQRRSGGRLLDRLGTPGVDRIRLTLKDIDGWMRALALGWAAKAGAEGSLPSAELSGMLARGLEDEDRSVFLVAAELLHGRLGPTARQRILRLAQAGRRTLRVRAWRVIGATLNVGASPAEDVFTPPRGHAALDERLRSAAVVQRLWAAEKR